ncbi:Cocaine and amphetamine-regulated transcript protein [Platysternon megacephalum]|uniref:Cocaine and amphetamine-regulated transcript protein n=1 Tax=Platysternon megacephalum TaxID=55544 RepID=A0A4D9DGY6_9SAUR|nr:Cocaine and amphetamine-regulated transcript protein [Platysternon megacephalum]
MESARLLALLSATLVLLLGARGQEEPELQPRALDLYPTMEDTSHEKELIEALQEVLEKLKSKRIPVYEKKFGQVPMVSDFRSEPSLRFCQMFPRPKMGSPRYSDWDSRINSTEAIYLKTQEHLSIGLDHETELDK